MFTRQISVLSRCSRWRNIAANRYSSTQANPIEKILIANRGEIACRVIRTAKKLGIRTVAVYSDADLNSMHVAMADESYRLGVAASSESYLNQTKVLDIARKTGAHAIHPGYGFLSENTEFAELCEKTGVIFIGPPAAAIRDMGIKSTSKHIMSAAGVPIIEGYHGEDQSVDGLKREASKIGYPLMIKAVRGGGGKGMRIVRTEEEFESQLESAKMEAMKSFGDQVMLIEKYVEKPRHVEVQVFGDKHGNYVYLFERDCSVQRRHQKVIEEAPAPGLDENVRRKIGEAAVKAAQAVNYCGAGTVEFVMDKDFNFYFMEMNTRLQVEHPITEMITGTDLVEWQLRVAAGEKLPKSQDELSLNGHSFEARVYAEDPNSQFMPGAGPVDLLETPSPSEHVRIDTGVRQGDEVSVHYDPMIAKLVVWGTDRPSALLKLRKCLSEFNVVGLQTNIPFLMNLCTNEEFKAGDYNTDFIAKNQDSLLKEHSVTPDVLSAVALGILYSEGQNQLKKDVISSPFLQQKGTRVNHSLKRTVSFNFKGKEHRVIISYANKSFQLTIQGEQHSIKGCYSTLSSGLLEIVCEKDGGISRSRVAVTPDAIHVFDQKGSYELEKPKLKFLESTSDVSSSGSATAPMPGVIEKVSVEKGQAVVAGQPLITMIAMKMEYVIKAPKEGVIEQVLFKVGDTVPKNAPLIKYES